MIIPPLEWISQRLSFNDTGDDNFLNDIAIDTQGNFYGVYVTLGTIVGGTRSGVDNNLIVFKLDADGNFLWIKQEPNFNTSLDNVTPKIDVDINGNIYVTYWTNGTVPTQTNSGDYDIVLFNMDTDGNLIFVTQQPTFNTPSRESYPYLFIDHLSNIYISYTSDGSVDTNVNQGVADLVVMKMDLSGTVGWTIQGASFDTSQNDSSHDIKVDTQGNVIVSYITQGQILGQIQTGDSDIVVAKFDSNGSLVWVKQQSSFNTTDSNTAPVISIDGQDNIFVTYISNGLIPGQEKTGIRDAIIFKLDPSGNLLWIRQNSSFNTTGVIYTIYNAIDAEGNLYVTYSADQPISGGTMTGSIDVIIFKMDTNGNVLWTLQDASFNTTGINFGPFISVTSSGNIYIGYQTDGVIPGQETTGFINNVVFKLGQSTPPTPPTPTNISNYVSKKTINTNLYKYIIDYRLYHQLNIPNTIPITKYFLYYPLYYQLLYFKDISNEI